MNKYLHFLIMLSIFYGCGSSKRFTSDEEKEVKSNRNNRQIENKEENDEDVITPTDEYKDYSVLETEIGVASFYADKFEGRTTANGEVFSQKELTAAHLNYPFGTVVRVTNMLNNRTVIVRINDRKPDFNGRLIDLTKKAAGELDMIRSGITKVRLEVLKWGN